MEIEIDDRKFEIFIPYEQIKKKIRLLGIQLSLDCESSNPIFIGILNGSFMFLADLMKEVRIPCEISFVKYSSYHGVNRQDSIQQLIGLHEDINGRDIIIVEDIIDSGHTLQNILNEINSRFAPNSVKICSLLVKPNALEVEIPEIQYVGFEIGNEFVVGYGLDYNGMGRNLPDIYKELS